MKFHPNSEIDLQILGSNIHTYFFKYDEKKPTALILPGHRSDTKRILPFVKILEEKYNIIAFDFPGFGKSIPYSRDYKEFISYSRKVLEILLQELDLETQNLNIFGISLGANVIVDYLLANPDKKFAKVGLMAPIYSKNNLTMKKPYKIFVDWFTRKLEEDRLFTKILQGMFDNKQIFTACMIMFDIECWKSKRIRDYEYQQWHLQTMQHWGATLKDFLEIDLSNVDTIIRDKNIIFAYPKSDQYLDVNASKIGFRKIFPNAEFKSFESDKHAPRGDFTDDEDFMASVKNILDLLN